MPGSYEFLVQGTENYTVRLNLDEMEYALDSTNIDLCLILFPWDRFIASKCHIR